MVFLGRDITRERNYSEQTAHDIDSEIKRIITEAYSRTRQLLQQNFEKLETLSKALLVHEVLDGPQVDRLLAGEELPPPVVPRKAAGPYRPQPPAPRSGDAAR